MQQYVPASGYIDDVMNMTFLDKILSLILHILM